MTYRVSPAVRLASLATGLVLGGGLLAQPAWADGETAPPVTADDSYTWYAGGANMLDVLANDTDPQGASLAVCKVKAPSSPENDGFASVSDGQLFVGVGGAGTFAFRYYACNDVFLAPAEVTITVVQAEPLRVHRIAGRPGRLEVVNRNDHAGHVVWGDRSRARPDGVAWVGAHSRRVISVTRSRIFWMGVVGKENGTAGTGTVRHIELPARSRPVTGSVPAPLTRLWSAR